jgi:hypothetical protein
MRIDGMGPIGQPEPKDKKNDKTPKTANTPLDKVDIKSSDNKANDAGYGESLKSAIMAQVERFENSTQIRRKSSSGYYEDSEIMRSISDKLIDSNELSDVVKKYHQANKTKNIESSKSEIRQEKVDEVKKKIEQDFYNDPANFEAFAQKIINHFGL